MVSRARDEEGGSGRAAKRGRFQAAKGTILKIHVHNFMTYSDAEIIPGPRLNLVLGPNGTGKSSLVNAICLGLAGATSLLGRADNVRDFVRRGEEEGYVQIWLSTGVPDQAVVIKRSLKARQNASEWRINGAPVNLKDVKEKVKELHVQLDNLCQFLPQDKVVEFAKLKPVELLLETEKAIGDSSLFHLHQDLIRERNQLKVVESAAKASQQELETLERANEGLKRDVDRFEQKQELEKQLQLLEDKLVWQRYWDLKARHEEAVAEHKLNADRLAAMQARQESEAKPRADKEKKRAKAVAKAQKSLARLRKLEGDIIAAKDELDKLGEDVDDEQQNLQSLDSQHAQWQADLAKTHGEIDTLREQVAALAEVQAQVAANNPQQEMARLTAEKRDVIGTINALQGTADDVKIEQGQLQQEVLGCHEQLRRLTDSKVQCLRQLENRFRGITQLSNWLDTPEAKALFRGRVYGPILCEVTLDDAQHAAFLEQHCPRDLWSRFVTEHQEDQDLLGREAHRRFAFRPIVTCFHGNVNEVVRHRLGEGRQYAQYGITATLDEVFRAPQTVKLVMCNEANLSETFCGTAATNAEQFLDDNPEIQRLLTPDSLYMVRTSRYNPHARSTTLAPARPAQLLAVGNRNVDAERSAIQQRLRTATQSRDEVQARLDGLHSDIRQEEKRVAALEADLKRFSNAAVALRQKRTKLQAALKHKEKQLQKTEERPDPRAQAPALRKKIAKMCERICTLIELLTSASHELPGLHQQQTVAEAANREFTSQITALERLQRDRVRQLRQLEALMGSLQANIASEKEKLRKLKREAEERTGRMTPELQGRLAGLPDGAEAIQDAIVGKGAEIDAIQLANPGAVAEFNARREQIARLAGVFEGQRADVQARQASLQDKQALWLLRLRELIAEVNKNFGRSFARIGCAGEVALHEERDPATQAEDFERFAVHIKVRFRSEESLQLLTAHRQSGGERSVSTILYLIAIQNVTLCPFRVVDEINQGMDPINERKVFVELVQAACQPDTPQCFLLTPKLLPNLPFSEHVTLLEIYNGTTVQDVAAGFKPALVLGHRQAVAAS